MGPFYRLQKLSCSARSLALSEHSLLPRCLRSQRAGSLCLGCS